MDFHVSILNRDIVLELNANWQRLKWRTVRDAIVCVCPDKSGNINALIVPVGPQGIEGAPMTWDEWIKLPVRECDLAISTGRGAIRVPLVIVSANYDQMPLKEPILTKAAIFKRDGFVDQYTGEALHPSEASVDHVIPKDIWNKRKLKGSPERWDNVVTCRKKRNFDKGNKPNFKAGLKLIKKPKAPKVVPASFLITTPKHEHQQPLF